MIRAVLLAAALVTASLAADVTATSAADECSGLQVCIPVAGPWVVIPPATFRFSSATWRLECPDGVVGGTYALASERAVAVEFPGRLGSPVNPGITTASSLVFKGTYAGRARRAASFQPFIGCITSGGGGPHTPMRFTRVSAVRPGDPITTRFRTLPLEVGKLARATLACKRGERLLGSTHGVGLYLPAMPTPAQLAGVQVVVARRGGKLLISATRRGLTPSVRAEVQVLAECAR
jgi:hypothetical protein